MDSIPLAEWISDFIRKRVSNAVTEFGYREPLVAFASADDARFESLKQIIHPTYMLPSDLLEGARSVVSFFIPFAPEVVEANAKDRQKVAREWAVAYVETNDLIDRTTQALIEALGERGIRANAEPATQNFDQVSLLSRWSHKSTAVIAGLGSFGLHHLVITDAGCAGRFGSLVLDAEIPVTQAKFKQRCLYYHDGSCLECVMACPVSALGEDDALDKQVCYDRLLEIAAQYQEKDLVEVCGKCSTGPCALRSAT